MTVKLRTLILAGASVMSLGSGAALAAGAEAHNRDFAFSFEGPFGTFDQNQLQRGLQVYTEICSSCHGLKYVAIRTLADEGGPHLPEEQVRAFAKNWEVWDPALRDTRTAEITDHFPTSAMENAPDLSLMAKSRAGFHGPYGTGISQLFNGIGGSEYVVSILTGYADNPACAPDGVDGYYYNTAFAVGAVPDSCKDEHGLSTVPGSWIAMPPPLSDDLVTYADGHPATLHHMAEDVTAFMTWAAEPKMMARKQSGFIAVTFLIVLSTLLYLTNKRLWAGVKGKKLA